MNIYVDQARFDRMHPAVPQPWRISRRTVQRRFRAALILVDSLAIVIAFYFADTVCRLLPSNALYRETVPSDQWLAVASVAVPIYLIAAANGHAFAGATIDRRSTGVFRAVRAMLVSIVMMTFLAFAFKISADFSRLMVAVASTTSLAALVYGRSRFLTLAQQVLDNVGSKAVLIVDDVTPPATRRFSRVIDNPAWLLHGLQNPRAQDRLAALLADADRVVISCSADRRLVWAQILKGASIRCEFMAPELDTLRPLGIAAWDGGLTLVAANARIRGLDEFFKRCFDLTLAGFATLALSPLLALVAAAIAIESRGPVLFVQERIGIGNKVFRMYKFRSMRSAACDADGTRLTARDDDRVTRVGRIIRRTSIDELPQLLNILRGEMSIVGPRPHALEAKAATKLYWEVDHRYWHRHAVKPGLTGLAQVRGYRGNTVQESDLLNRLQADLEYLDRWSIWRDLLIIMRTFRVIAHKNAF